MNTAWISLLRKELRLAQPFILTTWGMVLGAGLLALAIGESSPVDTALFTFTFELHALYPAALLWYSLSRDWQRTGRLWLHNPQPGWFLLSAKWAAALLAMLPGMAVSGVFTLLAARADLAIIAEPWPTIVSYGWVIAFFTVVFAVYAGAWFQFIWTATVAAESRSRFYALITVIVLAAAFVNSLLVRTSAAYNALVRWGALELRLPPIMYDLPFLSAPPPVSLGETLLYLLVITGLGAIAAWLVDHKLEV